MPEFDASLQPIFLYDTATTKGPCSPNVWKIRFVLNIKKLPHRTVPVEFANIGDVIRSLGGQPTGKTAAGEDRYTVPVITDPNTGQVIAESFIIAQYLDATYPGKPVIKGPLDEEAKFQKDFEDTVMAAFAPIGIYDTYWVITSGSQKWFRAAHEANFGKRLEELAPEEKRAKLWEVVRSAMSQDFVRERVTKVTKGITYKDITIAGFLTWVKAVGRANEYQAMLDWDDGRWGKFMTAFAPHTQTA